MPEFHKYHGLGNDFVIVDDSGGSGIDWVARAPQWCDRHRGIGADGILVYTRQPGSAGRMTIFNADGSRPEMCGNGLRCLARWLVETGRTDAHEFTISTDAGDLICVTEPGPVDWLVDTGLGRARFQREQIPMTGTGTSPQVLDVGPGFTVRGVSMGNPHAVIVVDGDTRQLAEDWGLQVSEHPMFPERTNAEFVRIVSPDRVDVTVFERGCGITQACGTGAAATVAALAYENATWRDRSVEVVLPGGVLHVTIDKADAVRLRGPATFVFSGYVDA